MLPEPQANGSVVILSFRYRGVTDILTVENGHMVGVSAHITRMGPSGPIGVVDHTLQRDNYLVFVNVEPGRYQISRISKHVGGSTTTLALSKTVVGTDVQTTVPSRSAAVRFAPDVVKQTTIDVPPNAVVFMGDFTATIRIPSWPSTPLAVSDATGTRTAQGEKAALEFLANAYPTSGWHKLRSGAVAVK